MTSTLNPKLDHDMAELLPWLFLTGKGDVENIVVLKDSSLMAVWEYHGLDMESSDLGALEVVAAQFDGVIRRLADSGATVWTTTERRQVDAYLDSTFSNPLSKYIDDQWRKTFEDSPTYSNRTYLCALMPTKGSNLSVGEMVGEGMGRGENIVKAIFGSVRRLFTRSQNIGFSSHLELKSLCRKFEAQISQIVDNGLFHVRTTRLAGGALLGVLKSSASLNRPADVVPIEDEYLDSYLSDSFINNEHRDFLLVEGMKRHYVGTFSLKAAPPGDVLNGIDALLTLPIHLRVNMVWRAGQRGEIESFLSNARSFDEMRGLTPRKLVKAVAASEGAIDPDDTPKTPIGERAEEYRQKYRRHDAYFGWMAASVVVVGDSEQALEHNMDTVASYLERSGLIYIRERDGSLSAFCVGIPGHLKEVVRWHFVEAASSSDLTTLSALSPGSKHHPSIKSLKGDLLPANATLRSRYNTVQYFNYHIGELGHSLFIGPTRNGKTIMQLFLTSQFFRYPNARVFILDKDRSCKPQSLLMGGSHIDLATDSGTGIKLNPMHLSSDEGGRTWLVGWLTRLLSRPDQALTDQQVQALSDALERVANTPGVRLTTLQTQLPSDLRTALAPWCEGGAYGRYFDSVEDSFTFGKLTCTEIGKLISDGATHVVRAYCDYAFCMIERSLQNRHPSEIGPTMIYFEEAGFLLDDPIFAKQARDYLMTLAKKKAFLVMTAQSPEPFVKHPELGAAVRDNVATVIFLPNTAATKPNLAKAYTEAFGLTDAQLQLIHDATPRMDYCVFHIQEGTFRVCRAQFPREIIACLRSDIETQSIFNQFYNEDDSAWQSKYLNAVMAL